MSKNVLVVVDMQAIFATSYRAILGVLAACYESMRRRDKIILLEYTNDSCLDDPTLDDVGDPTLSCILNALGSYPYTRVAKSYDGGGDKVQESGLLNTSDMIRLVGVNRCYCVRETHRDLIKLGYHKAMIITERCACSCCRCRKAEREAA